jgi:hypothetical protein
MMVSLVCCLHGPILKAGTILKAENAVDPVFLITLDVQAKYFAINLFYLMILQVMAERQSFKFFNSARQSLIN